MLIAQLSDPHLRPEGQLLFDRIDTAAYLERAVAHVLTLDPRPDVVIMTGDLVEAGKPEEYDRLRRLIGPRRAQRGATDVARGAARRTAAQADHALAAPSALRLRHRDLRQDAPDRGR